MAHLGQHRVDLSFITFNWFLVVFADSLISSILLQVWDAFLYEGTKVGRCRGAGGCWLWRGEGRALEHVSWEHGLETTVLCPPEGGGVSASKDAC